MTVGECKSGKKKRKSSEAQENVTFGILKKSDVGKGIIKKLKNNILIKIKIKNFFDIGCIVKWYVINNKITF